MANGGQAPPRKPAPVRQRSAEKSKRKEEGMVDCPCGTTHDDGEALIECERCKVGMQANLES